MSLFGSLNIAVSALQASEQALAVTGHNIANANNAGYTRQAVVLAALPLAAGAGGAQAGLSGGGVAVTGVQRSRDQFADAEFRSSVAQRGQDQVTGEAMDHLEALFNEPSDQGLQATMNAFFQSFSDLANNPEDPAVRATVREAAVALTGSVHHLSQGLDDVAHAADNQIGVRVAEVNAAATRIAELTRRISQAGANNSTAADLLDERDRLLDRLSELTGARAVPQADGSLNVMLGGRLLVGPAGAASITAAAGPGGFTALHWSDGNPVTIEGGEVAGLLAVRDQLTAGLQGSLTALVSGLISGVNAVHAANYGLSGSNGVNFFEPGGTPATMAVSAAVTADVGNIAASTGGAPGDGQGALAISRLGGQPLVAGSSPLAYYQGVVGALGVQAQQVQRSLQTTQLLTQQSDALRQSTGGVSLDEEAANMVRFQRSYQAAAHFAATMDDLLDTLINHMGT